MKSLNLRYYLIIIFLLLSISLSYLSYFYARDWGLSEAQNYSESQLLNTVSAVRGAVNQYHVLPFLVSQQLDVKALLLEANFKNRFRVRRYLEQTSVIAGAASVLVLDIAGKVAAQSDWREQSKPVIDQYANRLFFLAAIKGEQGSGVWFGERSGVWFYFSAPIYQFQKLIGVVVVRIDVAKKLENTVTREDFYLTDDMGTLAYASQSAGGKEGLNLAQLQQQTLVDGTTIQVMKKNAQSLLVQQVLLDDTQWNIGVITKLVVNNNARWAAIAVFSLCIVLALLAMYIREWRAKKRSQQQVAVAQLESEARGRHIINTAQSGLITLDAKGCITFINPLVMQQFGIALNSVINQPLAILFDQPSSFTSLKRVLDNLSKRANTNFSPLTGYEVVAKRSDGSFFPALFSIKQMRTTPVVEYLVTLVDITKRKQLERKLKQANDSLEDKVRQRTIALETTQAKLLKIEKIAVLGRMSTAIVHEINQPLTALRNYLAILERVKDQPQLMAQPLHALNHLVDNMAGITRQLKIFAYAKVEPQEPVDLVAVVKNVQLLVEPELAKHNVRVTRQFSTTSATVLADRIRLEQVLNNLFSNSIDALLKQFNREIFIVLSTDNHSVFLTIRDTGGGVSDEQLVHLFEPFFTTKQIGMGLGLGLSIVKNIVDDLNGSICAKNTVDGIEFRLKFALQAAI